MAEATRHFKESEEGSEQTLIAVYRYLGFRIAKLLQNTIVSANQITIFSIFVVLLASYLFYEASHASLIVASLAVQFCILLDYTDGAVARAKNMSSYFGLFLDHIAGLVREVSIPFSISLGIYRDKPDAIVWILGFLMVSGGLCIRLINKSYKDLSHAQQMIKDLRKKRNIVIKQFFNITSTVYVLVLFGAIFNRMFLSLVIINIYLWCAFAGIVYLLGKLSKSLGRMDSVI